MAPHSDDTGSGPVDGEEIKMDIAPHHQRHTHHKGPGVVKLALTGAAVMGGIVGLYLLYKKFFGKKVPKGSSSSNSTTGKMKRSFGGDVDGEVRAVYDEALSDEGFLEFLEEFNKEEGFF